MPKWLVMATSGLDHEMCLVCLGGVMNFGSVSGPWPLPLWLSVLCSSFTMKQIAIVHHALPLLSFCLEASQSWTEIMYQNKLCSCFKLWASGILFQQWNA